MLALNRIKPEKLMENIFKRQVQSVEEVSFSNDNSITGRVSTKSQSVHKYTVTFADGGKMTVICKYKSKNIIINGAMLLNYNNDPRFYAYALRSRKVLGFDNSHFREIVFYQNIDDSLKKHLVEIYGSCRDDRKNLYITAMRELKNNIPLSRNVIYRIMDAITDFHAFYYNDHSAVDRLKLNEYTTKDYRLNKPLLRIIFHGSDENNVRIFGEENYSRLTHFLENIDDFHSKLPCHNTLTHNDFSPRNIFWDEESVHIYDWELACYQNPEHDLVEFIIMTMSDLSDADILEWMQCFMRLLSEKADVTISDEEYRRIIEFNIMEYCVNRMSVLRAANRRLKLEFIDNMAANANRLMNLVIKGD
ncbi:MAG: phosphotransferase [Firmicutes bacterium]|nr:phosphotransferase [Bacillota bacterium]